MFERNVVLRAALTWVCVCWCVSANRISAADPADAKELQKRAFFEKHIRPLLIEKCYECHAADTEASGGLLLDSRAGWQRGGDSGPAIVPGQPEASRLLKAVEHSDPELQMPPEGPLDPAAVALIRRWIAEGAVDPRQEPLAGAPKPTGLPLERAQEHWAYRKLSNPAVPSVSQKAVSENVVSQEVLCNNPIDAFIARQLAENELPISPSAGRGELLRRLTYDLHGLPPSPESLGAFEADTAPDALERVVDRLLASPRFGERMARHWMDVARYAESVTLRGFVLPQAWRYRDYLIDAFRQDRSFNEMVREQIAGDLLESADLDRRRQQLTATTFLALGNTNLEEQDKAQLEMDYIDEQLDVIGRVFMAQTIGCARCHDHKFDPIPTSDYYAMAGIFKASQALIHENVSKWVEKPLPVDEDDEVDLAEVEASLKQLVAEEARIEKLLGKKQDVKQSKAVALAKLPGIVIDDAVATKVGSWKDSNSVGRYVGFGYTHDNNTRNEAKSITFQPKDLAPGVYAVRVSYTPGTNRSSQVTVRVINAGGESLVKVDQREQPPIDGLWFPLGEFRFEADGPAAVSISNEDADGHVIADAVQFLPLDDKSAQVAAAAAKQTGSDKQTTSDKPLAAAREKELTAKLNKLKSQRKQLEATVASRPRYMTIDEKLPAADIPIHIRGSVHNLGAIVPRGFLRCADFTARSPIPNDRSGRVEFAEWLTDEQHPLTSRVFVNRLWLWLYGGGLVRSVDNFGTTGESPTHPDLLDYLARDFMEHEWSPQFAMRRMLLSATYQRSVEAEDRAVELDPENKFYARSQRRRLDVESLRDAMLAISGELTIPAGGSTLRPGVNNDYRYTHVPNLRAVYLPILRNSLPELYDAFDFPNPSISSGDRTRSVVSPQALAMLNSQWILARADAAADQLLRELDMSEEGQPFAWPTVVSHLFVRCVGREPTEIERYTAASLIEELERSGTDRAQIVSRLIHGLFASIDFRYLD